MQAGLGSRPLGLWGKAAALRHLDLVTVGSVVALALMGLLASYSAAVDPDSGRLLPDAGELFNRQIVFCFLAAAVFVATILVDYRVFKIYAAVLYLGSLVLLVAVLTPLGEVARGSQRWIPLPLGILKLQPSELAKPVLAATLSAYLAERRGVIGLGDVLRCVGLTVPLALLVMAQPDLGTMLVLGAIVLVTLIVAGAHWRHLLVLVATAAAGTVLLFQLGFVHEYQQVRLKAFLDPERDPLRSGYNYRLTRAAVGNGGLTGTGILPDRTNVALTGSNLDYVPEKHTDFVFTIVAEQMGFVGSITLVGLYGVAFARGLRGAAQARDAFGTILAAALVGYLAFQVFVNVGMTLGLVPITGVPLPFVSYGGSSMVSSALAFGMIVSVRMRRFARPLT